MTATLHPQTAAMLARFVRSLAGKLAFVQLKRGLTTQWAHDDWEAACQHQLKQHLRKGDPLDVAAYAAFCWARGWRTVTMPAVHVAADQLVECITATASCIRAANVAQAQYPQEVITHDVQWLASAVIVLNDVVRVLKSDADPDQARGAAAFAARNLQRLVDGGGDPRSTTPETFQRWKAAGIPDAIEVLEGVAAYSQGPQGVRRPVIENGTTRALPILHVVRPEAV